MSLYDFIMNPQWKRRWQFFWIVVGSIAIIVGLVGLRNLFYKGWMW